MYKNLVLFWVRACTALACFLSPTLAAVEGATLPAGFTESIVFSGLTNPTAIRFSPDGRVFVTEKSGLIKVFASLSSPTPTVFHDLRTNVHNFWDRGLMGLELHPNFPTVPSVYVSYTYDKDPTNPQVPRWGTPGVTSDGCPSPPGATTDGCVVSGRLIRLEASSGSNVSTGTESVLIEGWGQQYPSHSLGTVMFGPDGALYVSAGDGASFSFADYGQDGSPLNPLGDPPAGIGSVQTAPTAEGGATRSQSLRRVSGPAVLTGTLIRVDPFTGAGLSGNPLFASADPNARRIVGYGFRNPSRFTFRPGTSELWIGDVGWEGWNEIDWIANPLTSTVRNFGWPCYEGTTAQSSYQALGLSICQNLYSQSGGHTPPYFTYSHSQQVVVGEACPIGSSSISGLAFNQGGNYPTRYQGALFFSDFTRKCIWSMLAGANGLPDLATRATFAAGAANPVDLQIGPGGDLFYVDFSGGTIRRIQFTSGNQAPNAVIQATPLSGPTPLTVTFDGSASSDPNAGDTLKYSWDLNGDGVFGDALTAQTSFTYTQANVYNVQLKVTDNQGSFDVARVLISVGNLPTAFIDAPVSSTQWQVGQSLTFSGHATDPDEVLPPSAFSWEIILHHCPSNCHTHPVQSFSGVTTASFPAPDHDYPSHLEIKLTVTDAQGLKDTKSILLDPQTVDLNFVSTPSGLELAVGSRSSPTPFTRTVIRESKNSVSAVTPQYLGGITYYFASWSDGGNQSHLITGAASTTYTATYRLVADTTLPTMPGSLTGTVFSGTQITRSSPASADNVGVGNVSTYSPITTATPTAVPGDDFNRANTLDLGTSWDAGHTTPVRPNTHLQIVGNRVRATTAMRDATETYTGVALANNQWAQVTLATANGTGAMAPRLLLRFSAPGLKSGYEFALGRGGLGFTSRIERWNAGVSTPLAVENATAWVAGDVLRAEAQGTTLRLYRNNVLVLSTTDATIASGRPGITIYAATIANVELDDFSAGNLTAVPDSTPPTMPSSLTGSVLSGTQITLSWPASTDNVGVTGYELERCDGIGCTAFVRIATPTTTSYSDTSVVPGLSYSYRVRARDAGGNVSAYSPITTATPTAVPGDNFNRANTLDLGTSWDAGHTTPVRPNTHLQIVGNRVRATTAMRDATETYTGVALANNQWAQVTLATANGTGAMAPRLLLRFSAPGLKSGYEFALGRGGLGFTSRIERWNAGVSTPLAVENATAWVAGDVLRAEAHGTTLRLYRNNVLVLSTTDATIASGRPGITIYAATIADVELDDFSAGHLNGIETENQLAGTTDWKLSVPATNREIEGYASATSVNHGGAISLYVNTTAPAYTIDVFRMGWYGGRGGRRVLGPIQATGTRQIIPTPNSTTGLVDCAWINPYTLATGHDWTSGIYLAKLTESTSSKQSYIIFVVRNDDASSHYIFQLPVTTYQAYNFWGGKSLYSYGSGGQQVPWGTTFGTQGLKVSFNRPYAKSTNPPAAFGMGAGEFLANVKPVKEYYPTSSAGWDYNLVRWLEKEGYDVTYITNIDLHSSPTVLTRARTYISSGHNEYWSWEMRANITAFRDSGGNLIFFGANTIDWQIRLERSPVTGIENRIIVAWKQRYQEDPIFNDGIASNDYLVTARFKSPPVSMPEDALMGVGFVLEYVNGDMVVSNASHWVFQNTGLTNGSRLIGLLGFEVDGTLGHQPVTTEILCTSVATEIPNSRNPTIESAISHMVMYTWPSGAQVFATGSLQWSWGLDDYNVPELRSSRVNTSAIQIAKNVLSRL